MPLTTSRPTDSASPTFSRDLAQLQAQAAVTSSPVRRTRNPSRDVATLFSSTSPFLHSLFSPSCTPQQTPAPPTPSRAHHQHHHPFANVKLSGSSKPTEDVPAAFSSSSAFTSAASPTIHSPTFSPRGRAHDSSGPHHRRTGAAPAAVVAGLGLDFSAAAGAPAASGFESAQAGSGNGRRKAGGVAVSQGYREFVCSASTSATSFQERDVEKFGASSADFHGHHPRAHLPPPYRRPSLSALLHPSTLTLTALAEIALYLAFYSALAILFFALFSDALFPSPSSSPATEAMASGANASAGTTIMATTGGSGLVGLSMKGKGGGGEVVREVFAVGDVSQIGRMAGLWGMSASGMAY